MGPQVWNVVQVGNVTLANNSGAFDSGSVMYEFIFDPLEELRLGQWNFVLVGKGDIQQHEVAKIILEEPLGMDSTVVHLSQHTGMF